MPPLKKPDAFQSAPELETNRLILRGFRLDDFEALYETWREPAVIKYTIVKPATREQAWTRLQRYVGHWAMLGFGYWAVIEKSSDQFIGQMGFGDFQRELSPTLDGKPELGWVLRTEFHGQGYATEALRKIIAWGQDNLDCEEFSCIIEEGHMVSQNVARKLGFGEFARTNYDGVTMLILTRDRNKSVS
jgi:RimJ/RimL family protein N-acetyltransferase